MWPCAETQGLIPPPAAPQGLKCDPESGGVGVLGGSPLLLSQIQGFPVVGWYHCWCERAKWVWKSLWKKAVTVNLFINGVNYPPVMLRQLHLMHHPGSPAPAWIRAWLCTVHMCSTARECQCSTSKTPLHRRQRHLSSCHLISALGHLQHVPMITTLCPVQDRAAFHPLMQPGQKK